MEEKGEWYLSIDLAKKSGFALIWRDNYEHEIKYINTISGEWDKIKGSILPIIIKYPIIIFEKNTYNAKNAFEWGRYLGQIENSLTELCLQMDGNTNFAQQTRERKLLTVSYDSNEWQKWLWPLDTRPDKKNRIWLKQQSIREAKQFLKNNDLEISKDFDDNQADSINMFRYHCWKKGIKI